MPVRVLRLDAQVAQFVELDCTWDKDAATPSGVIFAAFLRWAGDNGVNRPLTQNNFTNRLCRLGAVQTKGTGGVRLLAGIRLSDSGASGASFDMERIKETQSTKGEKEHLSHNLYKAMSEVAPLAPLPKDSDFDDGDEARI